MTTNDLRDRIAATIYKTVMAWDDFPFDQLTDNARAIYLEMADAVINELGLSGCPVSNCRYG